MSSQLTLEGKSAVITGAASGLGAITAQLFARLGARVVLIDVDEAVHEVASQIGDAHFAVVCDVSDEAAVGAAARITFQRFGPADILVNNAAVIGWKPLEHTTLDEWNRSVAVNLTGYFLCTKHLGRQMLEAGRGSIVNVASVAATVPEPGAGAYAPTKAAEAMLARLVAVEWGPRGIRANTVSPGMMKTPMAERFLSVPEALAGRLAMVPSRRIGDPVEVAWVIAFLASDISSYVNGQNIEVDGALMQALIQMIPRPGVQAAASTPAVASGR